MSGADFKLDSAVIKKNIATIKEDILKHSPYPERVKLVAVTKYFEKFKKLEEEGFLKKVGNASEELGVNENSEVIRYILTEKGLLLANDVFQELI